jgi:uncharacterized protein (TIGR00297 family)
MLSIGCYPQGEKAQHVSQLLIGLILGISIGSVAYIVGALTSSGALVAAIIGGLTFGYGGIIPTILLILFFTTSSALSRLRAQNKPGLDAIPAKSGRRDPGQVLANGGLPAALAVLYGVYGDLSWLVALTGALAASNADTWSTELGMLARRPPRLITTGKVVEPGVSGGVTQEGTLAGAAGAGLIGFTAGILTGEWMASLAVLAGGFAGALFDSLLGATVQAMYYCPACTLVTERHPIHNCGSATRHLRGWRWLNNDVVNFFASGLGAISTLLLWRWF